MPAPGPETLQIGVSRTPPGYKFWIPATLLIIVIGWIWGGWAADFCVLREERSSL